MLHFLCPLLFVCLLVQVSICDIRTMQIPDRLNLAILLLGLCRQILLCGNPWQQTAVLVLMGMLAAALPMYALAAAFPGSLGGGDIKMTGACGVYLGAAGVLRGTAAAMTAAGIFACGCVLLHRKKARQVFPLGPFLAAGFLYQMMCSS